MLSLDLQPVHVPVLDLDLGIPTCTVRSYQ